MKIKDIRKVFPLRKWECLSCKNIFTNRNCIKIKISDGIINSEMLCPFCHSKINKHKYLGEFSEVTK